MGYDIGWQVEGTRALSDGELDAIRGHVAKWANQIVGYDLLVPTTPQSAVQACAELRPTASEDDDEDDTGGYATGVIERVFDALGELQKLLPEFQIRVADDFTQYAWDGSGFKKSRTLKLAPLPADNKHWQPISKR